MSNKYNDSPDFIKLNDDEVLWLVLLCTVLDWFPAELHNQTRFPRKAIYEAVESKRLDHEGMVAAAYFGFLPMWGSYNGFQAQANRINNLAEHAHADEFRQDVDKRENSAAYEFVPSRGQLKRLIQRMDGVAQTHGFTSWRDALYGDDDVLADPTSDIPRASRIAFVSGPRFMWDLAKQFHIERPNGFVIESFEDWILLLQVDGCTVYGYALPPAGFRVGDFQFNGWLVKEDLEWAWVNDEPIFPVPAHVSIALRKQAEFHFPSLEIQECDPPCPGSLMLKWWHILHSSKTEG